PFDPDDTAAAAEVINNSFGTQLGPNGPVNKVNVKFEFPEMRYFRRDQASAKCNGDRGLGFRTKVKTLMRLGSDQRTATAMVDVVNPYFVGHFDLDRAVMVEKVVRLGFEEGALTQVIMRKPSEVLQTVKLPLAVVDALLAVPANFISTVATGTTSSIN